MSLPRLASHRMFFPLLALVLFPNGARSQGVTPTTLVLTASPHLSIFGSPVTITAKVSPAAATGHVTFYDGVTVLGGKAVSGGAASFSTVLLSTGSRKLRAYYSGDATYKASTAAFTQTVKSGQDTTFRAVNSAGDGFGTLALGPVAGDFNGDGKPDIATAGETSIGQDQVAIFFGNGDGSLQNPVTYPLSFRPSSMVAGDFNLDGNADVVVTGTDRQGHRLISILFGASNGTFLPAVTFTGGFGPAFAADFNNDGKPDLLLMGDSVPASVMLLGKGDGTFLAPQPIQTASFNSVNQVAIGDFNGDGKPDIAMTDIGLLVALGNGDGTFQPFLGVGVFIQAGTSLATGDFDADGKLDIEVGDNTSQSVFLGKGDGTFQPPAVYRAGGKATVADFDGDGIVDIALTGFPVALLHGKGDGTFQIILLSPTQQAGFNYALPAADFNGDGFVDLVGPADAQGYQVTSVLLGVGLVSARQGGPQSATVGAPFALPLQVKLAQNGVPLAGAFVTFSAPSDGPSASLSSTITFTDATGLASVTATANSAPGYYWITATAPGLTVYFPLTNISVAASQLQAGTFRSGGWFVDANGNRQWDFTDSTHTINFGLPGDLPVMGDWNGDGRLKVGVFRNGVWFVDWNGNNQWDASDAAHTFNFGLPGDLPVTGDWNGDGRLKAGVFRNGAWFVDWNGNSQWDATDAAHIFYFGLPGDLPVMGDWNGDGRLKAGVFRNGVWFVDYNGNQEWDSTDAAHVFNFGLAGDLPVMGDWNGDGSLKAGVFRNGAWFVDWNGNLQWDATDASHIFSFGLPGDLPVMGSWN